MNKFVKIAFVTVFSAIAAFGIYQSQKDELQISELVLANAEALARYELPDEIGRAHVRTPVTVINMNIPHLDNVGKNWEIVEGWDSIIEIVNLQVINICIVLQSVTFNNIKNSRCVEKLAHFY